MSYNVKGITVKINGDTTGLQRALNNVKAQTAGLDKTMARLKSSMKFNKNDYASFSTYQDLLSTKVKSTKKQLDLYNKSIEQFPKTHTQWSKAVKDTKLKLDSLGSSLSAGKQRINEMQNGITRNNKAIQNWKTALKNGTVSVRDCSKAIGALQDQNSAFSREIRNVTNSNKDLEAQFHTQKEALSGLGSTFEESQQHLKALEATALTCSNNLKGLESQMQFISKTGYTMMTSFEKASKALDKVADITKPFSLLAGGTIAAATAATISFEDAWTGVTKTVDGTPEQFAKINKGLKELATSTASSYQNIANYAQLAGQMGVPTDAIVGFTKTITQLGDTTNLVGEEAAQSVAKFANVMVKQSDKTNTYFSRLGSTIVDLGNKFATTEKDIMEMSTRLAPAGRQVGFTSDQVLGLSTALSSMGIKSQAGGSSMAKMLTNIQTAVSDGGDKLQKFATVSGMSAEEFKKSWGEDAAGTFQKFVEGIGKSKDITATLKELGITEIRQSQAMGALALNSDKLADALNVAKTAWADNTAMATEAEKRYGTLKTQLSQTWEAIKQAGDALGKQFTPYLKKALGFVKNLAMGFANLDDSTQATIAKVLLFTAALSPTAKVLSLTTGGISKLIGATTKYNGACGILVSMLTKTSSAALKCEPNILGVVKALAFGHPIITATAVAIGAVAAAAVYANKIKKETIKNTNEQIAANDTDYRVTLKVIDSYNSYVKSMSNTKKSMEAVVSQYSENTNQAKYLMKTIEDLNVKENLNQTQKAMLKQAVKELNEIYPDLNVEIDKNTGKLNLNEGATYTSIQAIKDRISQLQEQAKQEALASLQSKTAAAQLKAEYKNAELTDSIKTTTQSLKNLHNEYLNGKISQQEYMNQTTALKESINTLCTDLADSYAKLHETQTQSILQSNYLETQSFTQMGATMRQQYTDLAYQAAQAGIQIPQNIQIGITNGTASAVEAANYMATLMNMNQLVDQAGMIGGSIPLNVANSILANCGSITEATNVMNNLITLANAVQAAGLDGQKIPEDVAAAVGNGKMSVSDAVAKMMSDTDPKVKKAGKKMINESKNAISGISSAFSNDGTTSSAVGSMGSKMEKSLQPHLDSMVTSSAAAAGQIKANIQQAQAAASKKIVVNVERRIYTTKHRAHTDIPKSLGNDIVSRAMTMLSANSISEFMKDSSDYVTPRIETPQEVTQTVLASRYTSRQAKSNGVTINNSKSIMTLSNKVDALITAFRNAELTVNLQPMRLNQRVVADGVKEQFTINDLLSSYGKGK